jgi:aldose 1-epimerase
MSDSLLFGHLTNGDAVHLHTLRSGSLEVGVITYGGRIATLKSPDRQGRLADIVLGYESLDGYLADEAYMGAIIGRFANRISRGRFVLEGRTYGVTKNDGDNSLHGGLIGFAKRLWSAEPRETSITLRYRSEDGEEGYPGTVDACVRYSVQQRDFCIDYSATTTLPTIVNFTNHSYFNLSAEHERSILGHILKLPADRFTPITSDLIPTGSLQHVRNSPFDFRCAQPIGARIEQDNEQLRHGSGYDHNWILDPSEAELRIAAEVHEPESGRHMQVLTTEPGIQFYSGNQLEGSARGKQQKALSHRCGFSLETQHFPDSPNHPEFPSVFLHPGTVYHSKTIFRFSAW